MRKFGGNKLTKPTTSQLSELLRPVKMKITFIRCISVMAIRVIPTQLITKVEYDRSYDKSKK
jgi:hypothetical protein